MVYVLDADSGHPVSQPSVENDETTHASATCVYFSLSGCLPCQSTRSLSYTCYEVLYVVCVEIHKLRHETA